MSNAREEKGNGMLNLKACPFCNTIAQVREKSVGDFMTYRVTCGNHWCIAQPSTVPFKDRGMAADSWNTRFDLCGRCVRRTRKRLGREWKEAQKTWERMKLKRSPMKESGRLSGAKRENIGRKYSKVIADLIQKNEKLQKLVDDLALAWEVSGLVRTNFLGFEKRLMEARSRE